MQTIDLPSLAARQQAVDLANLQRSDLSFFVWGCFQALEGSKPFHLNWHVRAMCHALQGVADGDCKRLLITVPPRHLKTICTSVALPAWMIGRNPGVKIISASYGHDLAGANLLKLRRVMTSPFYRRLFPNVAIATANAGELHTSVGGYLKAVSVGGAVTGFGADLIVVDDLMKAADATSPAVRASTKAFYEESLLTRFDNKSEGSIVAIQQRLHEDDLAEHMIGKGNFRHLNLPAIAEADEIVPIGERRVHHRRKGEALFPQHEPTEVLQRIEAELGRFAFAAQYQQNPVAPGGNRIRWEHWGTYERPLAIDAYQLRVQSWDTGFSAEATSDFSACTTWGYRDGEWDLLDVYRARLDYGDLKQQVLHRARRFMADKIVIEKAAAGICLLRELLREEGLRGQAIAYVPRVSKEIRFETQVAKLAGGTFRLPAAADWLADFKRECQAFPNGANDDQADSLVQFLDWLGLRCGNAALMRAEGRDPPRRPGSWPRETNGG